MSKTRNHYTREFKVEALRLAETSGKPLAEVEREMGLSQGCLYHWQRELKRKGKQAFPGQGRLPEDDARIRQLERENAILKQERDILKKAIAVISPRQP